MQYLDDGKGICILWIKRSKGTNFAKDTKTINIVGKCWNAIKFPNLAMYFIGIRQHLQLHRYTFQGHN